MNALIVLGSSGGIIAAVTAVLTIGRGIFKQVNATEDNTEAINRLTDEVAKMRHSVNGHETRITVLEDWRKDGRQARS